MLTDDSCRVQTKHVRYYDQTFALHSFKPNQSEPNIILTQAHDLQKSQRMRNIA